jgi:hypothetical protein
VETPAASAAVLARESRAWSELPPAEYEGVVSGLLDEVGAGPRPVEALIALAGAILRREGPPLVEARARAAERLLAAAAGGEPTLLPRIALLVLLAWLRLAEVARSGPDSIATMPPLPDGVLLPSGSDPAAIQDPELRRKAAELAASHRLEVERWSARQRALDHLSHLAVLVRISRPSFAAAPEVAEELLAAMSLSPGLPPGVRESLAG